MYDSTEIARRALRRAEEIKTTRGGRRKMIARVTGVCALFLVVAFFLSPNIATNDYVFLEDNQTPLAMPFMPEDGTDISSGYNLVNYSIPVYDSISIPAGTTGIDMMLWNPEGNSYYLVFEIVLKETREILYTSGIIPPSMYVENPALIKEMEKGVYPANLIIRAYDPDALAPKSETSIDFQIIVS